MKYNYTVGHIPHRPATNTLVSYSHMETMMRKQRIQQHPSPEKPTQWEQQVPHHQYICPMSYQIPCWYSELTNGNCQCSYKVWRLSAQETIHQSERGQAGSGEFQNLCSPILRTCSWTQYQLIGCTKYIFLSPSSPPSIHRSKLWQDFLPSYSRKSTRYVSWIKNKWKLKYFHFL